jgi:hypothetical protein
MSKFSLVGAAGILIGILGVVGPIGWDYYKTKSEIELSVVEKSIIISKPEKLDGLVITYAGEALDELSKTTFSLTNSGRTPILKKDVASPITVKFAKDSNIIDAKIDRMQPLDLGALLQFNRGEGMLILEFSLLNPGDRIDFSVLAKTTAVDFDAGGRIAGVSSLHVVKDIAQDKISKSAPWTFYPVGFFSAFLALTSMVGFTRFPAEKRTKARFSAGTFELPNHKTLDAWIDWVNSDFFFMTPSEREPLIMLLKTLPVGDDFAAMHGEKIMAAVQSILNRMTPNLRVALVVFGIAAAGGWYVFSSILV